MLPAETAASGRPLRWGLGAKLFAILILLGAVAVLVTGVLGYSRARDALEQAIYNQLASARQTKARQVETYFRTTKNELRLLATSKMVVDAARELRAAFAELEQTDVPLKLRRDVVNLLDGLFTRFDAAARDLGIEKIKTVGDAYMAVCGLPVPVADHAERMVRMAIRMVHITREHGLEHHVPMKLRVGINSGPVVAGVIGKSKYTYDLWGDTVNLASRMESGGIPDSIQVTRPVYEALKDRFVFEPRGLIEVKGKGSVEAWLLAL